MVLSGYNSVPCAGLSDQIGPVIRVVTLQRKPFQLLHVILVAYLFVIKTPRFVDPVNSIDTFMNKNTQLGIRKPLHFIF